MQYIHIDGDVLISASFAVHGPSMTSPLSCDQINPINSVQSVEAFLFTLNRINSLNILGGNNLKLGAFAFDNCRSEYQEIETLVKLRKNTLMIRDSTGRVVNTDGIVAYHRGGLIYTNDTGHVIGDHLPTVAVGKSSLTDTQPYLTVVQYAGKV